MVRFSDWTLERAEASAGRLRWLPVADIALQLKPLRHRPAVQRGRDTVLVSHEARLRAGPDIKPGMRLRRDGRLLLIHAVEAAGRREGWLTCQCEEQQSLAAGRA